VSTSATAGGAKVTPRSICQGAQLRGPRLRAVAEESLSPLFTQWQQHGDRRCREALVERFLPLARGLARRYRGTHESIDDLTQVASVGLIKAIDRFDISRGNHFAAYAAPTILGELRRHFRDTTWAVHVTRSGQERAMEVQRTSELLTSKRGHSPRVGEIAEYLECDQEEVLDALQVAQARGSVSLDAPRPGGVEEGLMESRAQAMGVEDEGYALVEDSCAVAGALSTLSARERRILYLRFGQEMSQSEIAAQVGLSQMQISRLLRHSLSRMRAIIAGGDPQAIGN
jgi:RNA polymerase sigma-B factor